MHTTRTNVPVQATKWKGHWTVLAIASCLLLTAGLKSQEQNDSDQQIFTSEQMNAAADAAERADRGADVEKAIAVPPRNVVNLTHKRGLRERIVDVQYIHGRFAVVWVSSILDEYFGVSTKDDFQLLHTPEFDGVTYQACMAHACNTNRGIYLYVPRARQSFQATIEDGKTVTYSPNLRRPENKRYREWMERTVKDLHLPWQ